MKYGRHHGKIHRMYLDIMKNYMFNSKYTVHIISLHECCLINIETLTETEFCDILRGYRTDCK